MPLNLEAYAVYSGYSFSPWHANTYFQAFTFWQISQSIKSREKIDCVLREKLRLVPSLH